MEDEKNDVSTSENAENSWGNETGNVWGNENINWEERAKKAEAKIVELKKKTKEAAPKTNEDESGEKEEAKEETNENDNSTEKAETNKPTKTVEQLEAELAALKAEQEIAENVATTNMMGVVWTEAPTKPSSYTTSQLEKMTQAEYNEAKDLICKGEATVIRD